MQVRVHVLAIGPNTFITSCNYRIYIFFHLLLTLYHLIDTNYLSRSLDTPWFFEVRKYFFIQHSWKEEEEEKEGKKILFVIMNQNGKLISYDHLIIQANR